MRIVETFKSLQGEGSGSGSPAFFIRLAGCNVHCPFCDTKESWDLSSGLELSVKDLMNVLKGSITENHIIVITGGEPFIQLEELRELLETLLSEDLYDRVVIETSASVQIPDFVMSTIPAVKLNISPKKNMAVQPLYWDYFRVNEFRFAVDNSINGQNIEWVYSLLKHYPSIRRRANGNLYLSPVIHGDLSSEENWKWAKEVADYCKNSGEFKFSMQIHKLLGIR